MDTNVRDIAGFIVSLLGETGCSRQMANAHLARATRLDVDLFEVLATHYRINPDTLYRRAAHRLGLGFCGDIQPFVRPFAKSEPLEAIADLQSTRGRIGARAVVFVAPAFETLLTLWARLDAREIDPETVWITSPRALRTGLGTVNAGALLENAVHALERRFPQGAARLILSRILRIGFVVAFGLLVAAVFLIPPPFQPAVLGLITIVLVMPSMFRLWAAATATRNHPLRADLMLGDEDLPLYTILIPLRDEAHMVAQIAAAMRRLDYPPEKLDIKLVVESASSATVIAAKRELWDSRFSLVVVPQHPPLTKPKATNFALPLARGRHVVIFDAEDVPDPQQLRHAASVFAQRPDIACLQAELVIPQAESGIAKLFAAEYAGHFGVILPAITRAGFPMPLGGTSNHFRTEILRAVGGWDAFNVTEDADLGIRLARLGHRCASFASRTAEEAPDTVHAWVRQRTRWMKGWMQTLLVHTRHPLALIRALGWRNFLAFEVFVGSMVLSITLHGLFLVTSMVALAHDVLVHGAPDPWLTFNIATLLLGYAGAVAVSIIGLDRIERPSFKSVLFALPLYWLLAWYAVMRAAVDLVARPSYWSKTTHKGLQAYPVKDDALSIDAQLPAPHSCEQSKTLGRTTGSVA